MSAPTTMTASPASPSPAVGLAGKIALVTGGSRGIGRAIALKLGAAGAFVVVHCNQGIEAAQAVVAEIAHAGGKACVIACDLSEQGAAKRLFAELDIELLGRFQSTAFDMLVNNAGIIKREPIEDVLEETFDQTIQVNLKAPFFLIQEGLLRMRDGGRIINISSMGTRVAFPAMAAYAPAKAGLEALTTLLAAHLGPRRITVNAVLPGLTATDMNPMEEGAQARALPTIALGRLGQPDDIASVVAFLASDAGGWVTAQRIEVSGGQRI